MADEVTKPRSPRREYEKQDPKEREQDRKREGDDRSRRRSRSPRRQDDGRPSIRNRDSGYRDTRDRERRDDRPRNNRAGGGGGGGAGFKWKQRRTDNNDERDGEEKRLERGYRKRSRSPRRDRERDGTKAGRGGASIEDKFGVTDKFGPSFKPSSSTPSSANTDEPPKRPAAPTTAAQGEPMIIVHVNDRLGTKAAIPCLASDPIRLFKAQVAARIGRKPHEILLKRQGERPFKDMLTLEDYGVGNGVQIDLEIDTGE